MLHIVTGGSGSGKSAYAEDFLCSLGAENRIYLATMQAKDKESLHRITRHREMRKHKNFYTIECPSKIEGLQLSPNSLVLLECMSNFVANIQFAEGKCHSAKQVAEEVLFAIDALLNQCQELVIVTNEVFSDGVCYDGDTLEYLACLGRVNQKLSEMADTVIEVVYGIPICCKGKNQKIWRGERC